jgi:hypothetical protein
MKKVLFFAVPVLLLLSCSKVDVYTPDQHPIVNYPASITADFVAVMVSPKDAVMDGSTELKVGDNVTIKVMVQTQNDFIVSGEIAFLDGEEVDSPEIDRIMVPVYKHDDTESTVDCPDHTCDDWITINFTIPQSLQDRTIGMKLFLYGAASTATTTLTPAFKVVQ